VRGIAVEVLGVEGPKIIEGLEDALTQDFLFIDSRATPFRGACEFVAFVVAASTPAPTRPIGLERLPPALR